MLFDACQVVDFWFENIANIEDKMHAPWLVARRKAFGDPRPFRGLTVVSSFANMHYADIG